MTQSSIWKIENPDPKTGRRRRITLDEAVTFARVFDVPLDELTLPPEVIKSEEAADCVRDLGRLALEIVELDRHMAKRWNELQELLDGDYSGVAALAVLRTVGALRRDGSDEPWWGMSVDERRARAAEMNTTSVEEVDSWLTEILALRNRAFTKRGLPEVR